MLLKFKSLFYFKKKKERLFMVNEHSTHMYIQMYKEIIVFTYITIILKV